jgi:hypothetical protein
MRKIYEVFVQSLFANTLGHLFLKIDGKSLKILSIIITKELIKKMHSVFDEGQTSKELLMISD